jgi:hypothetical protein
LELGNRVALAVVDFGSCVIVFLAKVDESGSIRNLLASASLLDKVDNILFNFAVLKGKSDLLAGLEQIVSTMYGDRQMGTYSIIADTNGRCNICISPQTALREVEALLLQVLEFL